MTCGKLFAALGLVMLVAVGAMASGPMVDSTGLVLYYSFDGMGAGARGVVDGSLNGANGTVEHDVTMDFGLKGGAAKFAETVVNDFDGTGWVDPVVPYQLQDPALPYDYKPWPNKGALGTNYDYNYIWALPMDFDTTPTPTEAMTLALWAKVEDRNHDMATLCPTGIYPGPDGDYNTIEDNVTRLWTYHLQIQTGSDAYRTVLRDPTNVTMVSHNPTGSVAAIYDEWYHLAWTYDMHATNPLGGEMQQVKMYINGAEVWSADDGYLGGVDALGPINGEFQWGVRVGANVDDARQFVGLMDEFYWFNRKLSDTEMGVLAGLSPETPLPGDANLDRKVDLLDLGVVGDNWNMTGRTWQTGDFNGDGTCDLLDLGSVGDHWNATLEGSAPASVPEPGTVVLLVSAAMALLLWRRR